MTIKEAIQILELTAPISKAALKKAYRDALMVWHPDRFVGNTELKAKAEGRTYQINEAYSLLNRLPESGFPYQAAGDVQQTAQPSATDSTAPPSPRPQQRAQPPPQPQPPPKPTDSADIPPRACGIPASFLARIAAFYIDLIVPYAAFNIFMSSAFFGERSDGLVVGLMVACTWLYYALMECSPAQATIGKWLFGLKVTDIDGRRIGFVRASFRFFGIFLSVSLRGVSIWRIWRATGQFYHDNLTLCQVVRKPPSPKPAEKTASASSSTFRKSPDVLTVASWGVAVVAGVFLIALIAHVQSPKKSASQVPAGNSLPEPQASTVVTANQVPIATVNQTSTLAEIRVQAEQGNAEAQRLLGLRFSEGEGVTKDDTEAVKWFLKSAEQGDAVAQLQLGRAYYGGNGVAKDDVESVTWLSKAAEKSNADAQYELGIAYQQGEGIPKDVVKAVKWFLKAAEKGHAPAQLALGYAYHEGTGVTKDDVESVKWTRKAAEQGIVEAQYSLGIAYQQGIGVAKDPIEAVQWLQKAATHEDANAQNQLGVAYYQGDGVPKDAVEAVRLFRLAADQGHAQAQCNLAMSYINGTGVAQNRTEAVKWFRKAADQGDAEAQFNLGFSYATGDGATQDLAEAVKWYRLAAEQGFSDAQYFLGSAYAKGEGVIEDLDLAATWLRKAAEQGDAQALNDMGEYYIVKKEPSEAVKWFRRGAESGNSSAQYNLGLSLANGEGVAVDAVEAHAWWSIAAAQDHVQAKEDLKELEKVMSGGQVIAAQQKAAELKPHDHKMAKVPLAEPAPSVMMPPALVEPLEHLTTDQRLASGAVLTDALQNQGGRGKLTLDNGLTEDAFVKMISNDKLVASYYVRGGERFTFDHVPDGVYRLIYCTGFGWDAKKRDFSRGRHAVRYDELLSYVTTRKTEGTTIITSTGVITLTLHKVANGNTKTSDIPLEEFDLY